MKHSITRTVVATTLASVLAFPAFAATSFDNEAEKESYAVGASMGKYLAGQLASQKELGVAHDLEMVLAGFNAAMQGDIELDNDTLVGLINSRAEVLNEKVAVKKAALAKENLEKGRQFLADNAKKQGVTVTASGLQFEVMTQGDGALPKPEEVVTVHYKGMDLDGNVFADTHEMKQPAKVALINVIDGWNEGIQLMPVGSSYRFFVPADQAYGVEGKDLITPNSTLIFEIELIASDRPGQGGHGAMGSMSMNMGMMGH